MAKLPKVLFIREDDRNGMEVFYLAVPVLSGAIEDDGPTLVGTYRLVVAKKFKKTVSPAG